MNKNLNFNIKDGEDPVYTIGVAARLLGVHPRTLRLYENEGFIKPSRNSENANRLYSEKEIRQVECIRNLLKKEGMNIKSLKAVFGLVPCWKLNRCIGNKSSCESRKKSLDICWLKESEGSTNKFEEKCKTCNLYRMTKNDLNGLKDKQEYLKEIINH